MEYRYLALSTLFFFSNCSIQNENKQNYERGRDVYSIPEQKNQQKKQKNPPSRNKDLFPEKLKSKYCLADYLNEFIST